MPRGRRRSRSACVAAPKSSTLIEDCCHDRQIPDARGDEGGFAPPLENPPQALDLIVAAIDVPATSPAATSRSRSIPHRASSIKTATTTRSIESPRLRADEMVDALREFCDRDPIVSIEDGLAEDDWGGWRLTEASSAIACGWSATTSS